MENVNFCRRLAIPVGLALAILFLLILPVAALVEDPNGQTSTLAPDNRVPQAVVPDIIGGNDIDISNLGSGSPVIDVSNDDVFIAVVYYKIGRNGGGVHLKSASGSGGWVTTRYLGSGENPSLAFSSSANNKVFVVWEKVGNKAISFTDCTLNLTNPPTCSTPRDITTVASGSLETPDIVVDSAGRLHVAWAYQDGIISRIGTARSSNGGQNWTVLANAIQAGAAKVFETPQLAAAGSFAHLTFRRKKQVDNLGEAIEYRRTDASFATHSWGNAQVFAIGSEVNSQYADLANPTIAAAGSNVYLAWDAQFNELFGANKFGLMRATSDNSGGSGSWGAAKHITDDGDAALNTQNPPKISRQVAGSVPVQEGTLRPSLTISGNGFALVWQQRDIDVLACSESGNASSEIHYAYTDTLWLDDNKQLAGDQTQYSIDPDLAIDNSGVRHFVFMKDDDAKQQCTGGEEKEYGIFYRGPFVKKTNDKGEDPADPDVGGPPTVYLPIIAKN